MTLEDGAGALANEVTPLLSSPSVEQINSAPLSHDVEGSVSSPTQYGGLPAPRHEMLTARDDNKPLPRSQIFLLCYCALVEPVAYFSIFPFINQMILETGEVDEKDVGFWSGTIESLFSLTQMLLMIFYGRASDRLGRKPVLVFSLAGLAVSTSFFGMSKSLWQMIAFRCLAGVFGGSVVTVRTMISENCTPRTQARAYSFWSFARNGGIFLGPLIGGGLAKPAEQYPNLFGGNEFLRNYPYALPTICSGTIAASSAIVSAVFIKETLLRKNKETSISNVPMSTFELLKAPGVASVIYIYTHTMLLGLTFTSVLPVFCFTRVELGGFGFSPQMISVALAVIGASQSLWILLIFPPLQRKFSTGTVLRGCAVAWPIFFATFPLNNEFLRYQWNVPFWILASIGLVGGTGVSMAFTCVQLMLNDISPSPQTLGTLNAVALTINSGMRAVGPALFCAIFASGIKLGAIDGHLVWVVLVLLATGLVVGVRWLPEKAEGKLEDTD